jgi:hypothetical protein
MSALTRCAIAERFAVTEFLSAAMPSRVLGTFGNMKGLIVRVPGHDSA